MIALKWAFIGLVLLPVAEFTAFLLVVVTIGWFWAIVLLLGTSAIGILLLRRAGRGDFNRLRLAVRQGGLRALHLESPGVAPLAAGILLVFPGFITDVIGGLLLVPPLRRRAGVTLGRAWRQRRAPQRPGVIDLGPDEWHQVADGGGADKRRRSRRAGNRSKRSTR
jgi:UPF0716 protein FxsA